MGYGSRDFLWPAHSNAGRTEKMVHAWLLKNVPCSLIYSQVHFNFIFSTGVRTNNFFQLGTSKLSTRLMYCPPAYLHLNLKIWVWKIEFIIEFQKLTLKIWVSKIEFDELDFLSSLNLTWLFKLDFSNLIFQTWFLKLDLFFKNQAEMNKGCW